MNKNTVTKVIDFSGKDLSGSELMMLFQMCGKNYRMNNRKEKKDWTFKFIGSILDSVDFSGSVLGDNCDFTNASIDSALFTDTKVKFANWTGVDTEAAIDFGVK